MKKQSRVTPLRKDKRPAREASVHCYHDLDSQKELQSSRPDIARQRQGTTGCTQSFRPALDDARFGSSSSKDTELSDKNISQEVRQSLAMEADIDVADVEVVVAHGEVTLSGVVADRKMKRFVEEQVARCSGVKDIHNDLHFKRK
ncbi:BON domain-containing protein [Bdellovibrio bacteriovorus]|uniref:BON domain-containing protein n=1 Tax=Bdellovibrio bacteriovorus TaxID=959 RepID=UPI0035A66408